METCIACSSNTDQGWVVVVAQAIEMKVQRDGKNFMQITFNVGKFARHR